MEPFARTGIGGIVHRQQVGFVQDFGGPKVGQLDVHVGVQQNVLWLDIPVICKKKGP